MSRLKEQQMAGVDAGRARTGNGATLRVIEDGWRRGNWENGWREEEREGGGKDFSMNSGRILHF